MIGEFADIEHGSLFSVPGLRGRALRTGVKPSGALDLAVVVADEPMSAAAVFTRSSTAAAPVHFCRKRLARERIVRSFVVNSGNANALTGRAGDEHAAQMATALDELGVGPSLVFSTGVIGQPLPIDAILEGIPRAVKEVDEDGAGVAEAILTTDTTQKRCAVRIELSSGERRTVGGIAKGSGMIHPNMATMLAFMATDAPVDPSALRAMLERAVDRSFHEISVDGDTSTNDAVLLMARQPSDEVKALSEEDQGRVEAAITHVAQRLAEKIIEDGEGKTRIMEVRVEEGNSVAEARRIAVAIANSSLVKTALAGGDPNWGRILGAAGTAGVAVDPALITLELGGTVVFDKGAPTEYDEARVAEAFGKDRVLTVLKVRRGDASARMLTTDLSHKYVEINSEYTT